MRRLVQVWFFLLLGGPCFGSVTGYFHFNNQTTCPPNPLTGGIGSDNFAMQVTFHLGANTTGGTRFFAWDVKRSDTGAGVGQFAFNVTTAGVITVTSTPSSPAVSPGLPAATLNFNWVFVNPQSDQSGLISAMSISAQQIIPDSVCDNHGGVTVNVPVDVYAFGTPVSGSAQFHADLHVGQRAKSHTIQLKYLGVIVGTTTSAANNSTAFDGTINFLKTGAHNGDTYEWYVDGISQGGQQTVTLTNIGTSEVPVWSFQSNYAASFVGGDAPTPTPAATPTPTAFPTATPYATPTPTPGGTPPPSIIPYTRGGGSGFSSAVTVVNPQDIYAPITAELQKTNTLLSNQNTGASGNVTVTNVSDFYTPVRSALTDAMSMPATSNPTFANVDTTNRGHLDDLAGAATTVNDNANDVAGAVSDLRDNLESTLNGLPVTFGTVSSINIGTSIFGTQYNGVIELAPWSSMISIARSVMLWVMTIGFFFLTVRALTYQN